MRFETFKEVCRSIHETPRNTDHIKFTIVTSAKTYDLTISNAMFDIMYYDVCNNMPTHVFIKQEHSALVLDIDNIDSIVIPDNVVPQQAVHMDDDLLYGILKPYHMGRSITRNLLNVGISTWGQLCKKYHECSAREFIEIKNIGGKSYELIRALIENNTEYLKEREWKIR